MSKKNHTVTLTILNKEYVIACQPEEQNALLNIANSLNTKMRRLHDSGRVTGTDRIAIVAVLNLAHELGMGNKQGVSGDDNLNELNNTVNTELTHKLISMRRKIENVLENSQN